MNKTLLINRINPKDESGEKKQIFFNIGNIVADLHIENKILDLLTTTNIVDRKNIIVRYNGIELHLYIKDIPKIIKLLANADVEIYSVFEIYTPVI